MKLFKIFIPAFLLLVSVQVIQAQIPELIHNKQFRVDAQAAVDSLYNFNPSGAEKRLASWKKQYPRHPLWKLFDGMKFWWKVLSDLDNTSHDEAFFELMKKADYAASKLLYNQPRHIDALVIQAVANGYIARQYANRGEWLTSVRTARKAYKAYQLLQKVEPGLADLKLAEGLKLYYSAYLPEAYPVVKTVSWFLPDGNKQKGLKLLKEAAQTAIFARAEAVYFLGNINYNYEHRYKKAAHYFEKLYKSYPNNNYYVRLLVKTYYKTERYEEAMKVIGKALKRWEEQDLPFGKVLKEELYFWKGRILLNRRQLTTAADYFTQGVGLSKTLPQTGHRSYYVASAYYAGIVFHRLNKDLQAMGYFQATLDAEVGDNYKESARFKLKQIRGGQGQ